MSLLRGDRAPVPEIREDQIPEKFVVKQGNTMLVLGLLLIIALGGAAGQNVMTNGLAQSVDMLLAAVFCVLAGIVVLLKYKNHRLEVDGEELCYTSIFGQKTKFQASEIASVRRDISENPKLMGEDGRLLARFERNMENFLVMIAYLKKHEVSAL